MFKIGLVASSNGLGHARRLMYLGIGFRKLNVHPTIFVQKKQIKKLFSELNSMNQTIDFVEIGDHGLDGPEWARNGSKIYPPSRFVVQKLRNCDFVISDNLLWPYLYNTNFALFAHFTWIDYWSKIDSPKSKSILKLLEIENSIFNSIRLAFLSQDFTFNEEIFKSQKIIKIKLLRYKNDVYLSSLQRILNEVWLSEGTTNLDSIEIFNQKNHLNLNLIKSETFQMNKSTGKPGLVIGRPGLGTIRDCLASNTLFFPVWNKKDPELTSNVENLIRLKILPKIILSEIELPRILMILSQHVKKEKNNIKDWNNLSTLPENACMQIMGNIQ